MRQRWLAKTLALCIWLACVAANAQTITKEESDKVWADAEAVTVQGPATVQLSGQGTLTLAADQGFIPQPQASAVMRVMGNPGADPTLEGLVFPKEQAPWFVTIRFEKEGYVKDDDAKDWNAEDLLESYKEGTLEGNKEREKIGVAGIEILGWAQKPTYDAANHRLVWAMSSKEVGAPDSEPQGVNYNTYALGREGYFSLNLVTDLKELPTYKPVAYALLDALQFNQGKRYADFSASNGDKVAAYGLAALVVGVGAKKLGLLAIAGAFILKFFKIIAVAVLAGGAAITKVFKRKKADAESSSYSTGLDNHSVLGRELHQETIIAPYQGEHSDEHEHFAPTVLVENPMDDAPTHPMPLTPSASGAPAGTDGHTPAPPHKPPVA